MGWEEWLHICGASVQLFGKVGWCQTLFSVSCLGRESQPGLEPSPLAAVHGAEGLFGEHLHCCSAGAGIQVGSWASSVGTCEAERFRLAPDFLSTVQLEGEGSCSISHACLPFLDVTAINK